MDLSPHPGFAAFTPHLHLDDEVCPTCEQIIPNDRLEQVKARRAAQEREQESQYALKLSAEREQLTAQLLQQTEEAVAKVRQEAEAKEMAARAEERRTATAEAEVKVLAANAAVETVRAQADELKKQLEGQRDRSDRKGERGPCRGTPGGQRRGRGEGFGGNDSVGVRACPDGRVEETA